MSDTDFVEPRRSFIRRHKVLAILFVVVLLLVGSVFGFAWHVNSKLDNVAKFKTELDRPGRPERVSGKAMNLLLVGVDDGNGADLRKMLEAGKWKPGVFRSDTMMVLHLNKSHSQAQLISIPRDSYVPIDGYGKSKINAAFSYGGPELLAKTVEDMSGLYLDHVAVVDWEGFKGITEAIDGVDVRIPETVYDSKRDKTWTKGKHHIQGEEALMYVRQRYGLPNGDFDRIERQQNFMRAVLNKSASGGVLANPFKVSDLVGEVAENLAVDSSFTPKRMRDLALSSRGLRSNDFRFATVPIKGFATIDSQSVVELDLRATKEMFRAVAKDQFEGYLAHHDITELPGAGQVD